ncbi:MAG: hypothetical protein QXV79_03955, partial [Thermofilaceae archaeon]
MRLLPRYGKTYEVLNIISFVTTLRDPSALFRWGLKHAKLSIRIYTIFCIIWLAFWTLVFLSAATTLDSPAVVVSAVILFGLITAPFIIPLYILKRREATKALKVHQPPLVDPYLLAAQEKLRSIERYCKGDVSVAWGPVVTMAHDALISIMHRLVIDAKGPEGIKIIEQWRAERKLHLSTFIKTLKEWGILTDDEVRDLEILRDLRNRVVHEDFHPSREQALWA